MLGCPGFDLLGQADRLTQFQATWSTALTFLLWQHVVTLSCSLALPRIASTEKLSCQQAILARRKRLARVCNACD